MAHHDLTPTPASDGYAVRVRAYAAAHFEFDEHLMLTWPDAAAWFVSEYTGGEDGRTYPVTIHGEIRGTGESLGEAEQRLGTAVSNVFPILALAANAAMADPLAVASYGLDLSRPQPFVGYQTPQAHEWFPPGARRFDLDATLALITAVGQHPQTGLLHRAIESYRRALGHWVPEERLLAGEFLFIAAETLSRFIIESRAHTAGMTPKNLARSKRLDPEALRARYLLDDVFDGNPAALDAIGSASNGFEHGYMAVDDVRGLIEPALEHSMSLVRRALIVASGVDAAMSGRLLDAQYDEPRGLVPAIQFVRGAVRASDPSSPPALDMGVIELDWTNSRPVASKKEDGRVDITFSSNVKLAAIQAGVELDLDEWGMRAAHITPTGDVETEVHRAPDGEANS
jgi:hypothetical protein